MRTLAFAALLAALLAGCASTGPVPRPRSDIPPASPSPTVPAPAVPSPPLPVPPALPVPPPPGPRVVPAPTPIPPAYPSEAEGRGRIMHLLPIGAPERGEWAADIFTAFASLRIPLTAENLCASIAIIEQESSFQWDPEVPGLPRIVWGEIEKRRKKYLIPKLLLDAAFLRTSPDGRSYKARINALRTERQMNILFEDMIAELPYGRTLLAGYNPIRTGGPMQVSVDFAESHTRQKGYPYPVNGSIRNEVFTRRGGVFFGVAILLDYPAPYTQPVYRFADFNAGRYSSRNAAFQAAVTRLTKKKLDLDGDLLMYEKGEPSLEPSATLNALKPLAGRLGMARNEVRRDLLLEKSAAFSDTRLYRQVFAQADAAGNARLPRELLPRIVLKSPKITRQLTTEWFAKKVDARYQTCLNRSRQAG